MVAAAGDIACSPTDNGFNGGAGSTYVCNEANTAKLLDAIQPDAVLALGDLQYENGAADAFAASYGSTWGRWKDKTHPAVGNHEFNTRGGAGYFAYWGSGVGAPGKGWYSFDVGAWHLIALNSNCSIVGCGVDSEQGRWLAADLAAHPAQCTLAYWHHPRYSSGLHGDNPGVEPFWQLLSAAHADLVLVGHDHDYERYAVQRGIRQFTVGTGGRNLYVFQAQPEANSEVRNSVTFGVLQLTLHPASYDWKFVPIAGQTFTDSGTQNCT
ncbi:MAG: metallophosphoesterase [Actinobacteria bacterium]|nr:metallophosphoesterase [Actinomycetota bacterium]MBV8959679.1 metallophosphoesterase [Actinomycetota bacterium]MBV9254370.1 metallophosphoesterase [Actinomycetota bacterium]MBV9662966.1 metallophosphoesterase [Actinomycetota bacterium]